MVKRCVAFLSFVLLLHQGCSNDSPPPVVPDIPAPELSVDWVGSVEAGLRLRTNDSGRVLINLSRNDSTVFSGSVSAAETTLVQSGLLPNQVYRYQASRIEDGKVVKTSDVLSVVTMDTTAHEFGWQKYELGNLGGYLKDVTIISDTNVWVVGFIPRQPMSNAEPDNAARWDGQEWKLQQLEILKCDENGNTFGLGTPVALESVFGAAGDDVWFLWGGVLLHWDGSEFEQICLPLVYLNGFFVNKLWGTSPSNLYGVGNNGFIMHYDGARWRAMESGTTITLYDIWGLGPDDVWATGHCGFLSSCEEHNGQGVLLHYDGTLWETVFLTPFDGGILPNQLTGPIHGAWSSQQLLYVPSGRGLYRESSLFRTPLFESWFDIAFPLGFPFAIDGIADNNLFIVGDFGFILHWNGASWREYPFFDLNSISRIWSVAMSENGEVFAVGTGPDGRATVYHGRR